MVGPAEPVKTLCSWCEQACGTADTATETTEFACKAIAKLAKKLTF